jgi:hypothetical protein
VFVDLFFSAGYAHGPDCHLWPILLYNTAPYYLINGTLFEKKKLLNEKCVSIFSRTFVWNIIYSKNWATYTHTGILVFMQSTHYSCHILMKLEISQNIFEKYRSIKFIKKIFSGNRVAPCGGTDRHEELINVFLHIANAPKMFVERYFNSKPLHTFSKWCNCVDYSLSTVKAWRVMYDVKKTRYILVKMYCSWHARTK